MQQYDVELIKAKSDLITEVRRAGVDLRQRGREWWGCCPFHHEQTPSFHVRPEEGYWKCFGCGKGGDVVTFIMEYRQIPFTEACAALSDGNTLEFDTASSSVILKQSTPSSSKPDEQQHAFRRLLAGLQSYALSPAEVYLRTRGLTVFPVVCGTKYHPQWWWKDRRDIRPAVVFPIRDQDGRLVAAQGRYIVDGQPRMRTAQSADGAAGRGAFTTPGALDPRVPMVIVVESPINAMTLASVGIPAIATCGAGHFPEWLPAACAHKQRVLIGFDPDIAGAKGMQALAQAIYDESRQMPETLPIVEPGSDWNDLLHQYGFMQLRNHIWQNIRPLKVGDIINDRYGQWHGRLAVRHPADELFPTGWCEFEVDGGIHGASDLRAVCDVDGIPVTPDIYNESELEMMARPDDLSDWLP